MYGDAMESKPDTRTLPGDTLQELREQIVQLRKSGVSNRETARTTGVSERHASVVWHRYQAEGPDALVMRRRGRRKGLHEKLGAKQCRRMMELMFIRPSDTGVPGELWTRHRLQQGVKRHLKINVSIRTIGSRLQQWRMIPNKPIDLGDTSNHKINTWLTTEYWKLSNRAEKEGGELHWFVEQMADNPEYDALAPAYLRSFSMLCAIAKQGQIRFMLTRDDVTSQLFLEFLVRLITDVDKKVFILAKRITSLYIDKPVEDWLDKHRERIEVVYLPV